MAKFPFQIVVKDASSENKEETLICTELLRAIAGRRHVYNALWNDKKVVVKVFSHKISARRHLKREWGGLNKLARRGLSSPAPLFYGKTQDGQWAIVMEKIVNSSTALSVLDKTTDKTKKLDLMVLVCKELAKQHSKGVLQKDLHLGNFLVAGDSIFVLDPGQIQFLRHEAGRKASTCQLAMLAGYLPDSDRDSIAKLYDEYFKARGWRAGKSDEILLQKKLTLRRKEGVKKALEKCLRTSKRYLRLKIRNSTAVFAREFCQGAEPIDFIEHINALMDAGSVLKNGRTSYVSHLIWNGKDVVVKRYNHKGLIHSLRHTIKKSRARGGWLHAHRLRMLQIPTPKPLAFIEQRKGLLIWKSYFVTEYVEGQKLYDFLRDSKVAKEERSMITQQIAELLDKLGKYKITHGDLKHSNILITKDGPTITDLDGMKVHRCDLMCKIRKAKDLARFKNS